MRNVCKSGEHPAKRAGLNITHPADFGVRLVAVNLSDRSHDELYVVYVPPQKIEVEGKLKKKSLSPFF